MSYNLTQVCEMTGMPAPTVRFYEKEGLIPSLRRVPSHKVEYSQLDVQWLNLIKCLKNTGMPIRLIKAFVDNYTKGEEYYPNCLEILKEHRLAVEEQRRELEAHIAKIDYKIDYFQEHIAAYLEALVPQNSATSA